MSTMVEGLVPDELWEIVEPLLPIPPRPPYGGRRRTIPDRNCFAAIVYMVRTSTPWRLLPAQELGSPPPPRAGAGSPNGPGPACSIGFTWRCSTDWALTED